MNITFDASRCGLGNNGGTRTIVLSAEILQAMGHYVSIYSRVNHYTWNPISVPVVKAVKHKADVVIAVSLKDIPSLTDDWQPSGMAGKLVYWMRGWEQWLGDVPWTTKHFLRAGGHVITNASWLARRLTDLHVSVSGICFSGLDIPKQEYHARPGKKTIGFLYNTVKSKRMDLAFSLSKKLKDYTFYCYGVNAPVMYGNIQSLNQPTPWEKAMMYDKCAVWFAPTESEGFHNCPAEAALHGCAVVCNALQSNGMGDYATSDTANFYYNESEIVDVVKSVDYSKVPKMQKLLIEKIGSREKNMKIFEDMINGL